MKLICQTRAMPWERDSASSADDAANLVNKAINASRPPKGLNDLRRKLTFNSNSEVLNKLRRREWLLIKDETYFFDWGTFEKECLEQRSNQAVTSLMAAPPEQEKRTLLEFAIIDSETDEPLARRKCDLCPNGGSVERKTDQQGLTYLSFVSAPTEMAVRMKS